jgi:hypothetical protein
MANGLFIGRALVYRFEFNAGKYVKEMFWVGTATSLKKGRVFSEVHPSRPWGWPAGSSAVDYEYVDPNRTTTLHTAGEE